MANEDLIQRYEKAYKNYQKRRVSWVEKFHAVVKEIQHVKYAKNITEESIKRLEREIWPKFSERKKKHARKEYERQYEEGEEGIYFPKPPYKPPTEDEWLKIPVKDILPRTIPQEDEGPDIDDWKPNVDSEAELRQWIYNVIESVVVTTSPWGVPNEIPGERNKIIQLVESAFNNTKNKFGEEVKFLQYLQQNSGAFNELTLKAIHGYESGGQIHYIEQGGEQAMGQILTLLNFGNPISQWAEEDMLNGEFGNVFWGSSEDFFQ